MVDFVQFGCEIPKFGCHGNPPLTIFVTLEIIWPGNPTIEAKSLKILCTQWKIWPILCNFWRQAQKLVAMATSLANLGNISKTFHHDLKWKETFSQQLEQNHSYVCLNVRHTD